MARRTRFAEYKDRYANFRFELSEEGILLMQCHTGGGSLVWDWKAHDEMSDAFADVAYTNVANWITLAMNDAGSSGDALAGDSIYTAVIPGSVQQHRRLIRYRIVATDGVGGSVTVPYADDPQPNFAYFVYDGVPDYSASLRPGVVSNVVYSGDKLDDIANYHLIANATDVQNSQYNGQYNEVLFRGTLVYNGIVYDHVEFRNRGQASTYQVGKNKWKIEFLTGHQRGWSGGGWPE